MDLQTESWLEEIADRKEEKHVAVQATPQETFNEVSSPASQVAVTSGPREDKETQIYNNDPHLFVFDKEVGTRQLHIGGDHHHHPVWAG